MICISNWKCAHWEPWSEGTFQSIFDCCSISNPTGESIWDAHVTRLCLVITPVSGLFAYSACRHGLGEALAFKSLVHHSHFRIWTPWRPSWNAFMACCGLFDKDQLRLCRKQGIQDGVQCCLHNPAKKGKVLLLLSKHWLRWNYLFSEPERKPFALLILCQS